MLRSTVQSRRTASVAQARLSHENKELAKTTAALAAQNDASLDMIERLWSVIQNSGLSEIAAKALGASRADLPPASAESTTPTTESPPSPSSAPAESPAPERDSRAAPQPTSAEPTTPPTTESPPPPSSAPAESPAPERDSRAAPQPTSAEPTTPATTESPPSPSVKSAPPPAPNPKPKPPTPPPPPVKGTPPPPPPPPAKPTAPQPPPAKAKAAPAKTTLLDQIRGDPAKRLKSKDERTVRKTKDPEPSAQNEVARKLAEALAARRGAIGDGKDDEDQEWDFGRTRPRKKRFL